MNIEDKLIGSAASIKGIAFGMAAYTSSSIFGPLFIFVGIGYFLDKFFSTKPLYLILGIVSAFLISNLLIFRKISRLIKRFDQLEAEKKNK